MPSPEFDAQEAERFASQEFDALVTAIFAPDCSKEMTADGTLPPMTGGEVASLLGTMHLLDLVIPPGQLMGEPRYGEFGTYSDTTFSSFGKMGLTYAGTLMVASEPSSVEVMAMARRASLFAPAKRIVAVSLHYASSTQLDGQQIIGLYMSGDGGIEAFRLTRLEYENNVIYKRRCNRPSAPPQTRAFVATIGALPIVWRFGAEQSDYYY